MTSFTIPLLYSTNGKKKGRKNNNQLTHLTQLTDATSNAHDSRNEISGGGRHGTRSHFARGLLVRNRTGCGRRENGRSDNKNSGPPEAQRPATWAGQG